MTNIPGPLIINLDSTYILDEEVSLLKSQLIGGVILFEHNYHDVNQIKLLIQSIKNINDKLKIFIDHEGGRVQRFKTGLTHLPSFEIIGNVYNSDKNIGKALSYYAGYVAGYELKTLGIDINFSPVVDLRISSDVMKGRTFADNGNDVVDLVKPYLNGLIENGIIPTLKHFPGHGCVSGDTHLDLSKSNLTISELNNHLYPFIKIHKQFNVPIMTSHIQFDSISDHPVTTSSTWLDNITTDIFNINPFYISDDLEMKGISKRYPDLSRIKLLEKSLSCGCSMAIVTTMQDQMIINNKKSSQFYMDEYISLIDSMNYNSDITLQCLTNLSYNKGIMSSYKKAKDFIKGYIN